jgi:phospholipid/cholesterol/gamma-HCH transport system substrate-binding protein
VGEDQEEDKGRLSRAGRLAALATLIGAIVLVGLLLFGGGGGYTVTAKLINAGQLVEGNDVQVSGIPIGRVTGIRISDDGQALVELKITDDEFTPLRAGTKAVIRQFSQSGIANRFVDLEMPPGSGGPKIPDGGRIGVDETRTAVDLDALFNTIDARTRKGLRGTIRGFARQFSGRGAQANAGFLYLNPALSTSSRLFGELNRDNPTLRRFVTDSARLVTTLAERDDALTELVSNLNATTGALGARQERLADAVGRLPGFMRQANTTFVNLRGALDDLEPLASAARPVARRLGPFLDSARPFARDARPTFRDLNGILRRRGRSNDLYELSRTFPPFADIALETKKRSVDFGGGSKSVGEVRGAFAELSDALKDSSPIIAYGRPYTPDLLGWFDDFSTTGAQDALGGYARVQVYLNAFSISGGGPSLIPLPERGENFKQLARIGQFKRCPGGAETRAKDGSNVFSEEEQRVLDCREEDRGTGP